MPECVFGQSIKASSSRVSRDLSRRVRAVKQAPSRPRLSPSRTRAEREWRALIGGDAAASEPTELVRRRFGPLHLGTLPVGRTRELTMIERGALLTLSRQDTPAAAGDDEQETE